jgi:BON domain-containing protein
VNRAARAAVLALAFASLAGCSLAGRTLGTYVDDQSLTASVKVGLARKEPRNLTRVNVDTFNGTVYLTGEVAGALQKSDAEIAAWQVEGVSQVVNDLTVRGDRVDRVVSASPTIGPASPLLERIPGIARMDPAPSGQGALAYDRAGSIVATVYVRPSRDVALNGFEAFGPTVRPIDHVSVYGMPAEAGVPEAQMYILFWHVSPAAAAALR